MHHIDIHVRDLAAAKALMDAIAPEIGYRCRSADDEFVGYETAAGGRPRVGLIPDGEAGGTMRLAFGVADRGAVDRVGTLVHEHGARVIEGPGLHPEYGDDYYAVFFEDADGNKYEVVVEG
jgi:catechol 2,3-dioxygenase-like lactoylglutathione lyase family enzyme